MRAMRVDKLTLAAFEATTEIHLAGDAFSELPTLQMIVDRCDEVRSRCERLRWPFRGFVRSEIVACQSQVGGGSAPGARCGQFWIEDFQPASWIG